MSFYRCKRCGNIITYVKNSGVKVKCCGSDMEEMVANSSEASVEKHLPTYTKEGNIIHVNVGEGTHPQVKEHYIEWVAIVTESGISRKVLNPEGTPSCSSSLMEGEKLLAVYAYCNLHGLWVVNE